MSLTETIYNLVEDMKKTRSRFADLRKLRSSQSAKPTISFKNISSTNRSVDFEVTDINIVNSYLDILFEYEENRLKKLENELAKYEIKIK